MRHCARLLVILSLAVVCSACTPNRGVPARQEVLISAAASTQEVVESLGAAFEKKTGVKVKVNSGASSSLANQILSGAPADLFLSANREWAAKVADAGLAKSQHALLTNDLVIVVPKGNPAAVMSPVDLTSEKVQRVALAGDKVPAGIYAEQALTKLRLYDQLQQQGKLVRGQDVRSALSYVERGEADAGSVYSTDARVSDMVEVVYTFDAQLHDEIVYVLVVLDRSNDAAQQFAEFLLSDDVRAIYEAAGFNRSLAKVP